MIQAREIASEPFQMPDIRFINCTLNPYERTLHDELRKKK
jgi:hypothetical protein